MAIARGLACALVGAAALATGCGDDGHDDGHGDGEQFLCDGSEDAAGPGTVVTGDQGALAIEIVSATPSPQQVGVNQLIIEVQDAGGAPVPGVRFASITPFAAKHDHGAPEPPTAQEVDPGEYLVDAIQYVHRGPWHLSFELEAPGAVADTVQFTFCIAEADDGGPKGFPDAGYPPPPD